MRIVSKNIEKQVVVTVDKNLLNKIIIDALKEKKALDIVEINFEKSVVQTMFDGFVLCSATSITHADALCENVIRRVYENLNLEPSHSEGKQEAQWIILDYFYILVHIFLEDKRKFYNIEALWADQPTINHNYTF